MKAIVAALAIVVSMSAVAGSYSDANQKLSVCTKFGEVAKSVYLEGAKPKRPPNKYFEEVLQLYKENKPVPADILNDAVTFAYSDAATDAQTTYMHTWAYCMDKYDPAQ